MLLRKQMLCCVCCRQLVLGSMLPQVHKQVYLKKPGAKGAALLQLSDYQEDKGGGVLVLEDMQEAFGPGSYTISADGKTHTLEFEHGCSNTRFMPNTFAAALTVCVGPGTSTADTPSSAGRGRVLGLMHLLHLVTRPAFANGNVALQNTSQVLHECWCDVGGC
jgi:hypothetical protein